MHLDAIIFWSEASYATTVDTSYSRRGLWNGMVNGPTYNSEYIGSKYYHSYYYNETNPYGYGLLYDEKALYCGRAQTGVGSDIFSECGLMGVGLLSPNWTWSNEGSLYSLSYCSIYYTNRRR